eukprot:scaffold240847_cov18-Tisochrysis_lutea.AAC.1
MSGIAPWHAQMHGTISIRLQFFSPTPTFNSLCSQVLQPDSSDGPHSSLPAVASRPHLPAGQRVGMPTAAALPAAADPATPAAVADAPTAAPSGPGADVFGGTPGAAEFVRACAAAIRAAPRGKVALFVGGEALLEKGEWMCIFHVCVIDASISRSRPRLALLARSCSFILKSSAAPPNLQG